MLVTVGHLVAAFVAAVAFLVKLRALGRDPANPRILASAGICLGMGVAVTAGWAPVHSLIDRVSGVPNLAKLVEHGSALLAAAAIQFLFLHLGDPGRARRLMVRRGVFLAVAFGVMVAAFSRADFPESEPLHFAERYGDLPPVGVYMLAFLTCLGVTVVDILRVSAGYARYAGARLRTSMRLLSAGAAFGAGFVAHKALFICLKLAGVAPPWAEPAATQTLIMLSVSLIGASFVLATVRKAADGLRAWPRRYATHRDLHALWYLLYRAMPTIALHPPRRPEADSRWAWRLGERLYRRCVEISDGLRTLGPLDESVAGAARQRAVAAGWSRERADAAGEAAAILVALRRFASGATATHEVDPALESQSMAVAQADVQADASRLALVSTALSEELVRAVAARTLDAPAGGQQA